MFQLRNIIVHVIAVTGCLGSLALPAAANSLRVCADPDYLPYSNKAGQGFENKIAETVAKLRGDTLEYTWESTRDHGGFPQFLAITLDAHRCDLVMSIPYGSRDALTTRPYYISSYVFVFEKAKQYDIENFDSPVLKKLKIGYEEDTQTEDSLKIRGMTDKAVAFDVGGDDGESPATVLKAIKDGKIDVMVTWQPAISGFLQDYPDLETVQVPNSRAMGSPEQFTFPMAMGVRSGDDALKQQLDELIAQHQAELSAILNQSGVETNIAPPPNTP